MPRLSEVEDVVNLCLHRPRITNQKTAYLEPDTNPADNLYRRPRLDYPGSAKPKVKVKRTKDHYGVEKLLVKKTSQGQTQYLVRWLGYSPEHNV